MMKMGCRKLYYFFVYKMRILLVVILVCIFLWLFLRVMLCFWWAILYLGTRYNHKNWHKALLLLGQKFQFFFFITKITTTTDARNRNVRKNNDFFLIVLRKRQTKRRTEILGCVSRFIRNYWKRTLDGNSRGWHVLLSYMFLLHNV